MTLTASASTIDYRTAQQSHHQKLLAGLLAHQAGASVQPAAMLIDTTGNSLGLSTPDLYSSSSGPSSAYPSTTEVHRSSTSSTLSSGSSHTYLKSPHLGGYAPHQPENLYAQSWNNIGWGEMTFGMVAQAQANLAMNMNHANSAVHNDKQAPQDWLPLQQSINPGYLRQSIPHDQYSQPPITFGQMPLSANLPQTFAPSPLRSVSPGSGSESSDGDSDGEDDSPALSVDVSDLDLADGVTRRSTRLRKRSDSDFILESPGASKRPARRLTWTSTNDIRQREFEIEVHKREVERMKEMKKFEESNGKGNRKERRRLQNRLAQRAFRARSKIQGKEFNEHLGDLESLTVDQNDRIAQLTQIVDRLQKENAALKAGRWAAFQGASQGSILPSGDGKHA